MSETTKTTEKKTKTDNRVEVFVPRGRGNEDPNLFISVNGVNYLLPRGKKSVVPAAVAFEYERAMRAEAALYEKQDEMMKQADMPT